MNWTQWLSRRSPAYVGRRAALLASRYGLTSAKAATRVEENVATLAAAGCTPTLPTPGRVVERYPHIVRRLQDAGAEIAVHSYDHVDLAAYPLAVAEEQLLRAMDAFARHGIAAHGFRCPYLSCTDELLDSPTAEMFRYSSNRGISWNGWQDRAPERSGMGQIGRSTSVIYDTLQGFYQAPSAQERVCVPWRRAHLVEIPLCLPDDLELFDGLHLPWQEVAQVWLHILHQTHQRGEMFMLLYHPELAWRCREAFLVTLNEAHRLTPAVWLARLHEIAAWWEEKAGFSHAVFAAAAGLQVALHCSDRATILARGLPPSPADAPWGEVPERSGVDTGYWRMASRVLTAPAGVRPFVGLPAHTPSAVAEFLQEQGYLLEIGADAQRCAVYLDDATLSRLTSQVALIDHIEATPGPLLRYGRWPDGAKSAFCISGDLDALSLWDYASRLFVR
jgi:peptidoglycan/xylan/chitin deacetylase (PgdA/CDA1 family)